MRGRCVTSIALLFATCASIANARADSRVEAAINDGLAAMGGRSLLSQLRSLRLHTRTVTYRLDDSERHDGPPWLDITDGTEVRDEIGDRARLDFTDGSAQWFTTWRTFYEASDTVSGVKWRGSWLWSAKPSLGDRQALSPERVLLTAESAPDVHLMPPVQLAGAKHDVIAFTWKGFPVHLYIDAQSHLLRRVEASLADPRDQISTMLGPIDWRTDFEFYRREANGLTYPWQQNTYRNGLPSRTLVIVGLEQNPELASGLFDLAPDAASAVKKMSVKPYADTPVTVPPSGDPLVPVASNVWQIGGNWYVFVVRQSDGLVVIEAPQSSAYSAKIISLLAARFPHVPIKAVVSTTDTTYHYAGLRTYVARQIPIYALKLNTSLLARFIAKPRTAMPDELSVHSKQPIFRSVSEPLTIGTGSNRIELYPIGGSGDARMMMAYLPGKRLLYGSSNDFSVDQQRTTFNAFELVKRVDALKLPVDEFVAIHTDKMPWQEFRRAALTQPPISAE